MMQQTKTYGPQFSGEFSFACQLFLLLEVIVKGAFWTDDSFVACQAVE